MLSEGRVISWGRSKRSTPAACGRTSDKAVSGPPPSTVLFHGGHWRTGESFVLVASLWHQSSGTGDT